MNETFVQFLTKNARVLTDLFKQDDEMTNIIKTLQEAKKEGRQVFICGNGGSAGTATHLAADLFKMAKIKAISLCDNTPLMTAIINDDGWKELFRAQLERLYNKGDILISISVHGAAGEENAGPWSANIGQAISYVNCNGGTTIGLTGFDGGEMKYSCHHCLIVPANSTPIVEALHTVLHHYIAFELMEGNRK